MTHITTRSDGLGGEDVYADGRRIGNIWAAPKHPSEWFARPVPPPAQRQPTRLDAIAWLAGMPVEEVQHLEKEEEHG